jgi:hypothetical protein
MATAAPVSQVAARIPSGMVLNLRVCYALFAVNSTKTRLMGFPAATGDGRGIVK